MDKKSEKKVTSNLLSKKILVVISIFVIIIVVFLFYPFTSKELPKTNEEIIFEDFVKANLNDEYIPSSLNVVNKLTGEGNTDGFDYLYGAIWHKDNKKFYVNLHYNDNESDQISNLHMYIITDEIPINIDEETSNFLFNKYFKIEPRGTTKCTVLNESTGSYCENFWIENNENKKGVVLISTVLNNVKNKFLSMCEFPVGGNDYESNSCIRW